MKVGLTFGSFNPPHKGHLGMINFAKENCDYLYVLVCARENDDIPGELRYEWVKEIYKDEKNIEVMYTDIDLPGTSESSWEISTIWSEYFKVLFEDKIDIVFTSEKYGYYVSEIMGIEHMVYDIDRENINISSTQIRENPFEEWEFITDIVKPYFVKKICICGTESSGKSTITKKLSEYYNTNFVEEQGRYIVDNTHNCSYDNLVNISIEQAVHINKEIKNSNKLLFVDTDIITTKAYSRFLFNKELEYPKWVDKSNLFDMYIFLNNKVEFVQDGTRLSEDERNQLNDILLKTYKDSKIKLIKIKNTNWDKIMEEIIEHINNNFFNETK